MTERIMRKSKKTETERVYLRKGFLIFLSAVLLGSTAAFAACTAKDDDAVSRYGQTIRHGSEQATFIPQAPDYNDATMWVTADGDTDGTGADIFYVVSTWEEDWTQTVNGQIVNSQIVNSQIVNCHYADVWNPEHRGRMADLEINKVAAYNGLETEISL